MATRRKASAARSATAAPRRPAAGATADRQPERLGGLEVDDQLELGGLLDGQVGRLGSAAVAMTIGIVPFAWLASWATTVPGAKITSSSPPAAPGGERRSEEAPRQSADERSPVHHSMT